MTAERQPRAAVYVRVSTEEQRERQSIATQRDYAERYCDLNAIPIHRYYADDGVSGTVPLAQRPAGAQLIEDARDGKFTRVLLFRLDRIGRDPRLILNAVSDLEALSVQVQSMTESFDTSTPAGRMMLTMLSGFAGYERESIIERSVEGTNRLARAGSWLGGIVPFGYRVEGKDRDARLVPADEPLPGLGLSEADVVRLMYRMLAVDRQSCMKIADLLTEMGVSPAYTRDGRLLSRGKRVAATSGIWRPARVRNLVVNTTYKGIHQYGKRSRKKREIIERPVPALVDAETWERAQQTLQANMLFSMRNARRQYLLRGLIKCALCGLTFIGASNNRRGHTYYRCNGRQQARGLYGLHGERCPSASVNAQALEDVVWADIEGFLRDPGDVLTQLAARMNAGAGSTAQVGQERVKLAGALATKAGERDAVIGLFRRGRIDDTALDRQLDEIAREESSLQALVGRMDDQARAAEAVESRLQTAETLLRTLHERLAAPLDWDTKRQLVETLIESIRVETRADGGKQRAEVVITYRFGATATRRGTHAETNCTLEHTHRPH